MLATVKTLLTAEPPWVAEPKSVPSMELGVASPSTMSTLLPVTLISAGAAVTTPMMEKLNGFSSASDVVTLIWPVLVPAAAVSS